MLSGKDLAEIVWTPSGFESPSFDATPGRRLMFEQIEGYMPQHDKVLLTVILTHATGILLKGDIEHPVEAIFDLEVGYAPPLQRLERCPASS